MRGHLPQREWASTKTVKQMSLNETSAAGSLRKTPSLAKYVSGWFCATKRTLLHKQERNRFIHSWWRTSSVEAAKFSQMRTSFYWMSIETVWSSGFSQTLFCWFTIGGNALSKTLRWPMLRRKWIEVGATRTRPKQERCLFPQKWLSRWVGSKSKQTTKSMQRLPLTMFKILTSFSCFALVEREVSRRCGQYIVPDKGRFKPQTTGKNIANQWKLSVWWKHSIHLNFEWSDTFRSTLFTTSTTFLCIFAKFLTLKTTTMLHLWFPTSIEKQNCRLFFVHGKFWHTSVELTGRNPCLA